MLQILQQLHPTGKYKERTLSDVEKDYLDSVSELGDIKLPR